MGELLPGKIWRESQFYTVNGARRTGMCNENAIAMVESWATQSYVWTGTIYERMARDKQLLNANGASDIAQQHARLVADGFQTETHPYAGNNWPDALAWLHNHLDAGHGIVLMVANGAALVDSIGGGKDYSGAKPLAFHSFTPLGHHPGGFSQHAQRDLPAGVWCADGDNSAVGNVLQFYPDTVLAAAIPAPPMDEDSWPGDSCGPVRIVCMVRR